MHVRVVDIPTPRWRNFLEFQMRPLDFMQRVVPLGDIVSLRTGVRQASYVVGSPDIVQDILVTHDRSFRKGRSSNILRRTIGEGLLTTEFATHRAQRKLIQPAFYKEKIAHYAQTMQEETLQTVETLGNGDAVNMHDTMMQLTLSIICRTMFGTAVEETKQTLAEAVNETIVQTAKTLYSPIVLPLGVPTRAHRKHRHAIKTLEKMVYAVIGQARQDPARYASTLVHLLMQTTDDQGKGLSEQEIRDQMMTMLLAGHETTANLLTWVWILLDDHRDVQQQFFAEIDALDFSSQTPFEWFRQLPYTMQIIQETLRLYPPAWMILREAHEDVSLRGTTFTKGSAFLICPYAMHRQAQWFDDPLTFRPARFAEGKTTWPKFAYFPFGGGSRSCIGSQFALMEAVIVLAAMSRFVRFERISPAVIQAAPLVSLRVKGQLQMVVHRRNERVNG